MIWVVAAALLGLAALLAAVALSAVRRRHRLGPALLLIVSLLVAGLGGLAALAAVGMGAYRALTLEQTAAMVEVVALAPQRFRTVVTLPEGERRTFELTGDELYLDARILKWDARANLLGLHTAYQLDRIAGRYRTLDDEQTQPRSVFQLGDPGPVDLFGLVDRFRVLEPLVDAEYGSGTFVPLEDGARYEVLVSTTGLLIRRRE